MKNDDIYFKKKQQEGIKIERKVGEDKLMKIRKSAKWYRWNFNSIMVWKKDKNRPEKLKGLGLKDILIDWTLIQAQQTVSVNIRAQQLMQGYEHEKDDKE